MITSHYLYTAYFKFLDVCTCRSSKFFLTIEQAVVKGGKVLIEHFPSPMDPALQPVIEIGNNKGGKFTQVYMAAVRALIRIATL